MVRCLFGGSDPDSTMVGAAATAGGEGGHAAAGSGDDGTLALQQPGKLSKAEAVLHELNRQTSKGKSQWCQYFSPCSDTVDGKLEVYIQCLFCNKHF